MTKFLITAGLMFEIALLGFIGFYLIFFIGIKLWEFMDYVDREYGFKGSVMASLISLTIVSIIGAFILTLIGV